MHRARRAQASLPVRLRRAATCRVKLEGDDWSDPPPTVWPAASLGARALSRWHIIARWASCHHPISDRFGGELAALKSRPQIIFTAPVKPFSSRKLHQLRPPMIRCWCGREARKARTYRNIARTRSAFLPSSSRDREFAARHVWSARCCAVEVSSALGVALCARVR